MKFCVLVIFIALPWISRIGDWALRWTEGNERLQVFFVMLFFPVVMNATQYYIIDSFIKNQKPSGHEPLPSDDGDGDNGDSNDGTDDGGPFVDPLSRTNDEVDPEAEDEVAKKEAVDIKARANPLGKGNQSNSGAKGRHSYDPQFDGDGSPTVVGSASNSEREQLLSKGSDSDDEGKPHRR